MMMFGFGSHWAIWQVALMWVWMTAFGGLLIGAAFALVKIGIVHRPKTVAEMTSHATSSVSLSRLPERIAKGGTQ